MFVYVCVVLCVLFENENQPVVFVSLNRVKDNLKVLRRCLDKTGCKHKIYYALKSNYNKPIIDALQQEKIDGLEVISKLEYGLARDAGFDEKKIVFNGIFRDKDLLNNSLKNKNIVNIDSFQELYNLPSNAKIGIRIHPEFTEDGNFVKKGSKLGFNEDDITQVLAKAKENKIAISGISFHIFSNNLSAELTKKAIKRTLQIIDRVEKEQGRKLDYIDIGGGLKPRIFYKDEALENYIEEITVDIKNKKPYLTIILEPGRFLVSDAVFILSNVKGIKKNQDKHWAILDISTNYLIPATGSNFLVLPYKKRVSEGIKIHFADRICSPAGTIDTNNRFDEITEKDKVIVANAGAYTTVMKEQFVFFDPTHAFIQDGKVIKIIKQKNKEYVKKYHYW